MSKVDVFGNAWIDLVFEGRNQQYGAYQLRKQESRNTMIALFSGIGLLGMAACIPAAVNYFSNDETAIVTTEAEPKIVITDLGKDDLIFKTEPPKPEPAQQQQPATAAPPVKDVVKFNDKLVATSDPVADPPKMDDFTDKNPGQEDVKGTDGAGDPLNTTGSGVEGGTGSSPVVGTGEEGPVPTGAVDVMPEYPGGLKNFYKEVARNYNVPASDQEQSFKVFVSFVVEKDGSITDVKVTRDASPALGLGKEAVRVLQKMKTKWKPGIKNGKPVRTAYNLPITINIH